MAPEDLLKEDFLGIQIINRRHKGDFDQMDGFGNEA